jgi:gag-polypeptide of LTR copia-type/Pol polyprotein, beta-barrel domain
MTSQMNLEDIKDYQSSSGSAFQVFPKLQSDKYFSWSASMESVLRLLSQWEVVTGTFVAPMRAKQNEPIEKKLQLERAWEERVYTEIDLRVEDQQRMTIRENRDPRIAWHKLRNMYGTRLANTRATLLAEITRTQYDGSGILEHKSKMDALRMKLTEAGHITPEPLYLNFFANSLPEEYDAIVNTIDFETDMVDKVVCNLHQIETKRGLDTTEGSVFAMLKKNQPKTASTSRSSAPGAKESSMPNVRHSGKCYSCRGQGHWSNKCPSPRKKKSENTQQESKNPPTENQSKGSTPSTSRGLFSTIETSMFLGNGPITRQCFIDTATSGNFVPNIEDLHELQPFAAPKSFTAANGGKVFSKGIGTVKIKVSNQEGNYTGEIPHVQWAPDIHTHLFSPGQLIKDGFTVTLHSMGCTVVDPKKRLLADVREKGNIYLVNFTIIKSGDLQMVSAFEEPTSDELADRLDNALYAFAGKESERDIMRWHQQLGHLNVAAVRDLIHNHSMGAEIDGNIIQNADCLACIQGKQHKFPFKMGRTRATSLGKLIHMDLAGPMQTTSLNGKRYFLIIVDDYS